MSVAVKLSVPVVNVVTLICMPTKAATFPTHTSDVVAVVCVATSVESFAFVHSSAVYTPLRSRPSNVTTLAAALVFLIAIAIFDNGVISPVKEKVTPALSAASISL